MDTVREKIIEEFDNYILPLFIKRNSFTHNYNWARNGDNCKAGTRVFFKSGFMGVLINNHFLFEQK